MSGERAGLYERIDFLTSISRGFQGAIVLAAAAEFDLFDLLASGALTPEQAAEKLGLDARALGIVMHALAGMKLLEKEEDGSFVNTALTDELLVRGQPSYQGDILRHNARLIRRWVELPEVLRTGSHVESGRPLEDKGSRRDFILGMSNIARLSAGRLIDALHLKDTSRMLDLGGGPGTYAIAFCEKFPQLKATVFDLPEVIDEITVDQVRQAGLSERVGFMRGDYLKDDYGSGYDLVLVSNIIHSLGERENRELVERCHAALVTGGRIIIKDFLLDEDMVFPAFASMFAVNMLVGTANGRSYSLDEVRAWLADLGFGDGVTVVEISPQARVVIGTKQA